MIIIRPWLFRLLPSPPRGMALWPFVLIRDEADRANIILLNHERIHIAQQREMLVVFFYLHYLLEYLARRTHSTHYAAYRMLSAEREAFENQGSLDYIKQRTPYAWLKQTFTR